MKVESQLVAYDELARLLREQRRAAGLTQSVVAERLGKPQSFVAKYERGERQLDLIEFLLVTSALGADPTTTLVAVQRRIRRTR